MSRRRLSRLAWASPVASFLICGVALAISSLNGPRSDLRGTLTVVVVSSVPFPLVGALIASRQPRNPIGWLLCASGLLQSLNLLGTAYGEYSFITHPGSLPAAFAITWLGSWAWMPSLALVLTFFPLLFPDGRLPAPGWRWVGLTAAAGVALLVLGAGWASAATPGVVLARGAMGGPVVAGSVVVVGLLAVLVASVASVCSLIGRFRRSRGEEREQMKWVAFAGAFAFVASALQFVPGTNSALFGQGLIGLGLLSLPVAAGVAILKYRLYDIDVVINKTVVFGALAAFITLLYVGIVVGVGRLIGSDGRASPGLSILATAIVAIGFQPARERVQRFANRLVYGKRATPYQVMASFARRMAGTIDVGQSLPSIAQAAVLGVGGSAGTVRLLLPGGRDRVETWPVGSPPSASPTRAVEVRYQGDPIGEIAVTKDPGDPLRPGEESLLLDLASQAGLALHNVRLTDELAARLEELAGQASELQRSRQRLVTARDTQRRGLERDISDGPVRQLAEMARELDRANQLTVRDPRAATDLLESLGSHVNRTLDELRDLARGIFPPLLADKGIAAALEAHIRKVGASARVEETRGFSDLRFEAEAETCVYFCCLQALQNVQRHANNAPCVVGLAYDEGELAFEVLDEGPGYDVAATQRGLGLQIAQDRVDALEGMLEVHSAPGRTAVAGRLPTRALQPAT
jgi:signal transduction histidine kinase